MRIHVVSSGEESIGGYERVEVDQNGQSAQLLQFSDNECDNILAGDALDYVSYERHADLIASLVRKLRMGGAIVVGGTDIRLFCQHVNNTTIGENEACTMLSSKRSMSTFDKTRAILESLNLNIRTLQTNGTHYEYSATR